MRIEKVTEYILREYLSISFDSISQEYVKYSIWGEKTPILCDNDKLLTDFFRCIDTGAFYLVNMISVLLD